MSDRDWAVLKRDIGTLWPAPYAAEALPDDALVCESVTSILRTLHKQGLEIWKLKAVARTAYELQDSVHTMDCERAVRFLADQRNWVQEHELSDAACGTEVHRVLEETVLHGHVLKEVHPEALPMVRQFDAWRETMRPEYQAVECTVFDPTYKYAGTLDAVATLTDGRTWLLDYKTSRNENNRGPFPEWALQLAAYKWAPYVCPFRVIVQDEHWRSGRRYYINPAEMQYALPMPDVDGAAVVHLTPSSWRMYPVRVDELVRDAFYYVRGVQQFVEVIARRSVFGAHVEGAA